MGKPDVITLAAMIYSLSASRNVREAHLLTRIICLQQSTLLNCPSSYNICNVLRLFTNLIVTATSVLRMFP